MFKNARYVNDGQTSITMDLMHPIHGWIPITINAEEYPELWYEVIQTNPPLDMDIIEEQQAQELIFWRHDAALARATFCLKLRDAGFLCQEDALNGARGDFPPPFVQAVSIVGSGLSQADAEIIWAGTMSVGRMNPITEAIRKYSGMTPIQMDALFGRLVEAEG